MRLTKAVFLFLLIPQVVLAYTVVLPSGEKIEGTLIKESESTIQIKDDSGAVLSFSKSAIDMKTTEDINKSNGTKPVTVVNDKEKSLAELAKETQQKKTGKARVLTKADLEKTPEISIMGSDQSVKEEPSGQKASSQKREESKEKTDADLKNNELYWRQRAEDLRNNIGDLKKEHQDAEDDCIRAGGHNSYEYRADTSGQKHKNRACKRADEIADNEKQAEDKLYEFEKKAALEGIPPDWIKEQ
jgi:hypothetical protein